MYVGKVQPSTKSTTDKKKSSMIFGLFWKGRGANRGSVLSPYCKCDGGRDGGCTHIAAAMYSLEDIVTTRGEKSVTSGLCQCIRNSRVNVEPCEVNDLLNTKDKVVPIVKAKRRPYQIPIATRKGFWFKTMQKNSNRSRNRLVCIKNEFIEHCISNYSTSK